MIPQHLCVLRLRSLIATIMRERKLKAAMNRLEELEDYLLNDIGIGRCDIENIVRVGRRGFTK
ncbi:DUF1127 domain-containing protein [Rhizobium sp. Leaf262]|uniref:DUF1127 domain-containing protein n=1 Tax=Rhizobium sp. Leaf262 TaxID=1736312 RepID=UPI000AF5003E|nr:DUF1127 domain-containing protein [Rhizobium sp. Leaf262]